MEITVLQQDRCVARISQMVRDLRGEVISEGLFEHVFAFEQGLIVRMDIKKIIAPAGPAGRNDAAPSLSGPASARPSPQPISTKGSPAMTKLADLTARYTVGDFVVTSLFDGTLQHKAADDLRGIAPEVLPGALRAASLTNDLALTVNAFLVRDAGRLILIDAGCGHDLGPGKGFVADALVEAGVRPDEIELVLLTHLHPDHIGGLLNPDGTARFGQARVLAPATDAIVFLDEDIAAGVPDAHKFVFAKARAVAAAYAGRFEVFEGSPEVAPGITAVALPGHSPGHTGYRLRSGQDSLLIWGDIVHCPALQFSHPETGMIFDADPALTDRTRLDAFTTAAASGEPVAGMHMLSPGFARVIKNGEAYRFDLISDQ